jgi:adenosylmethionine-8-amino-7-oxononanoate aminotransferase
MSRDAISPGIGGRRNLQDTVALCPPLIISEGEIDELLRKFGKALNETAAPLARS